MSKEYLCQQMNNEIFIFGSKCHFSAPVTQTDAFVFR